MIDCPYTDQQVAEARRLNKLVEEDWSDRLARGLPASGQAEAAYRREWHSIDGELS